MSIRIANVTFDSTDPLPLARWWAGALGGEIAAENDGWFVIVSVPGESHGLAFQKVDDPTVGKNRIHLDFEASDRAATVDSLVAAGATVQGEHDMDGFVWTVLADPDGNLFCVSGAHA